VDFDLDDMVRMFGEEHTLHTICVLSVGDRFLLCDRRFEVVIEHSNFRSCKIGQRVFYCGRWFATCEVKRRKRLCPLGDYDHPFSSEESSPEYLRVQAQQKISVAKFRELSTAL